MRLKRIIEDLEITEIRNFKNYNIKTITHISSDITKDSIFICIKGNNFDGNNYIAEAISKGAKCIITEDKNINQNNATIIIVKDIRIVMSVVAKNFYNRCVDSLKVVGIIGTSGKTSTSLIISQILSIYDSNIGVIGTNGVFIGNIRLDNKFTTPDPLELHYIFYQMKMLGVKTVIMEVSAQAIYYKKVYGINFDIGVFTNISREHLDFFGSMENYVKVKMNFFSKKHMKECVINTDDFYGRELAYKVDIPCISYGVNEPANSFAVDIKFTLSRTQFFANILDDIISVDVPYVGLYNVYNILAGLTVSKMLGLNKIELQNSINNLREIDGRFNLYKVGEKDVIIDFAHTPDSMEKLLSHISKFSDKKIISIFGCVSYSDSDKRYEMASVVDKYSDSIIITSDNSGNTPFGSISEDIIKGINKCSYHCIEDRKSAIEYAYQHSTKDNIIVIMGKGAEDFQKIGNERVPFSDRECVLGLMEK